MANSTRVLAAIGMAGMLACAGGQSDQGAAPDASRITVFVRNQSSSPVDVSVMYERSSPQRLGTVSGGTEATFSFFYRVGTVRMVVAYVVGRTSTSNGFVGLERGDTLQLVVPLQRNPELTRHSP
jgi:hypothetical protein